MRYVSARLEQNLRDDAYRFYVTDALKAIGGLDKRYYDIIEFKPPIEETRTPEEIIANIRGKL